MAVIFGMKATPAVCQQSNSQPYAYFKNPDSTIFSKKTKPSFFKRIVTTVTNGITKFFWTSDTATLEVTDRVLQQMPFLFTDQEKIFKKEINLHLELNDFEYSGYNGYVIFIK